MKKSKFSQVSIADLASEHVSTLAITARMIVTEMETRIIALAEEAKRPGLRRRP